MKIFFRKFKFLLLLLSFPLFLTSCGQETLHEDLSEKDANKMLVVLSDHGIEATKLKVASAQSTSFSVMVSSDDISKARRILTDYNLPRNRDTQKMIQKNCGSKDVISSPDWEKCRQIVSKQSQISQHLESDAVPAVVKAEVIISPPKETDFGQDPDPNRKTTASAVLRIIRTDSEDKITEEDIKRYISSAVDGLAFRDVSVIISYIDDPKMTTAPGNNGKTPEVGNNIPLATLLGLEMLPASASRLKIYLIVFLVLLILMGAFVVFNVIKMTKLRQELKVSKSNLGEAALSAADAPPAVEPGGGTKPEQLPPGEEGTGPSEEG